MRQRAAASLLYQSKYAEAAFRNLLKLIFLQIVGRILAFYSIYFVVLIDCVHIKDELTEKSISCERHQQAHNKKRRKVW